MPAVHFNPEKVWLDRIEQQYTSGKRIDLSGPYGIPAEQLTESICLKIMASARSNWRNSLGDVPAHLRTPAVCMAAITRSSSEGQHVPAHLWTPEFILQALDTITCADQLLKYIPDDAITAEICDRCIECNGYALGDVPARYLTDERCLNALHRNGSAIAFVPAHLRTLDNFRLAAASNAYGALMSILPSEVTENEYRELCLIAVRHIGGALETICEKARAAVDAEIVYEAVLEDPNAIRYVPAELVTDALLLMAVTGKQTYQQRNDSSADGVVHVCGPLHHIAEKWPRRIRESLCFIAVSHCWQAIGDVPSALRSVRVVLAATKQNSSAWTWIPDEDKTGIPELAIEWVKGNLERIEMITDRAIFLSVVEALDLEFAE